VASLLRIGFGSRPSDLIFANVPASIIARRIGALPAPPYGDVGNSGQCPNAWRIHEQSGQARPALFLVGPPRTLTSKGEGEFARRNGFARVPSEAPFKQAAQ